MNDTDARAMAGAAASSPQSLAALASSSATLGHGGIGRQRQAAESGVEKPTRRHRHARPGAPCSTRCSTCGPAGTTTKYPSSRPSRRPARGRVQGSPRPRTAPSTSAPPTPTCRPACPRRTRHLKNIPLAISAQIVAYNVPGVTAHLKLSGKVLSAIYQGQITKWNASQIASLNPGVTLPDTPIVTLHRSDSSGDTFLFTTYLSKTDPSGLGRQGRLQHHRAVAGRTGCAGGDGQLGHGVGLQGHRGLHRLRRHQLPDPDAPGRPRLRRSCGTPRASTSCRRHRRSRQRRPRSSRRPRPTAPSR